MSKLRLPPCPYCGPRGLPSVTVSPDKLFGCKRCGGLYDGDPNDGGDYDDRDPSLRMQRAERQQQSGRGR